MSVSRPLSQHIFTQYCVVFVIHFMYSAQSPDKANWWCGDMAPNMAAPIEFIIIIITAGVLPTDNY